jgi:hypothetical protein
MLNNENATKQPVVRTKKVMLKKFFLSDLNIFIPAFKIKNATPACIPLKAY